MRIGSWLNQFMEIFERMSCRLAVDGHELMVMALNRRFHHCHSPIDKLVFVSASLHTHTLTHIYV